MTAHASRLARREDIAAGTAAFHLDKPPGFDFRAGQAIDLVLPDGQRHAFSIVSAPHEPALVVATRLRDSAYKRALVALPPGAPLAIDGPFGDLVLHRRHGRAAVLVAGGIGITPFVSMLRHAAHEHSPMTVTLVYSNRRVEDAAFLDELQALGRRLEGFELLATMTRQAESARPWSGHRGAVDTALVRRALARGAQPVVYVAGPPAMVAATRFVLLAAGVDDDDIRSEDFHGY